jgi:hypothetical protein
MIILYTDITDVTDITDMADLTDVAGWERSKNDKKSKRIGENRACWQNFC